MDRSRTGIRSSSRRVAGAIAGAMLAVAATVPVAQAATLNPPPPEFERCHAQGNQTICHGTQVLGGGVEPTGIICGSGATAFEIVDSSGFVRQEATRWYDANGGLVRRQIHDVWLDSAWTNPLAGTFVPYRQAVTYSDVFAVPGDLATATETTTGVVNFVVPGAGAIVRNAGRTVIGSDGTLEFRAGPQAFIDFFLEGDASALDPLCAALE